jgi:hypothetical protein
MVVHTVGGVETSFMPDFSVVISTAGTLLGALGGVAMTHRINVRREEAQARREEAQANRQRRDQRTQARRQAYVDLLGTATQLKVEIEVAGQRHWKDMNVRLASIQRHAASASLQASCVAMLSQETAEAAFALAAASGRLAAATTNHTDMGYRDEQFLGGQITRAADFKEFDECIKRFYLVAAQDIEE